MASDAAVDHAARDRLREADGVIRLVQDHGFAVRADGPAIKTAHAPGQGGLSQTRVLIKQVSRNVGEC